MIWSNVRRAIECVGLAVLFASTWQAGFAAIVISPPQTLTFDTLTNTNIDHVTPIETGYGHFDSGSVHFQGFDWATGPAFIAVANSQDPAINPSAIGFGNGAVSLPNVAYKYGAASSSTIVPVSGRFVFLGASFTAGYDLSNANNFPNYPSDSVQTLTLASMSGGNTVVSQTITLNASSPFALSVNWAGPDGTGIDSLVLTTAVTSGSAGLPALPWVMDNFRYAVVAVPEPASALYLAAGVTLLVMLALRRNSRR